MKKKIFMLLALVCMTLTASASAGFDLTAVASDYGTIAFTVDGNDRTYADEGETVTVTITPYTGYVVNEPSGQWYAAIAATRRQAPIDLLTGITLTPVQGQDNQWTFTMQRANAEISATYKKLLTHADITVTVNDVTYSGVAQTPTVTVKDGENELVKDQDYTVSYSNNTVAALSTATENAPTVTITAVATSEKYAGETTKTFTINKAALTVTAEDKSVTYGDAAPTYTVTYDGFVNNETNAVLGGTLALACDYVKNTSGAGTYTITPSGLTSDNYDITFTNGTLTVGAKALESSMIAAIEPLIYNTQAQTPEPAVTFNGMTLVKGTDFTYSYSDNTAAGTATVTITAVAEGNYSGSASKSFTIKHANAEVWFDPSQIKKTYGDPNFIFEAYAIGDGTLTYSSDDEKIATVDEYTGEVTIVGVGEVNIEATLSAGANYDGSFNWYQLIIEPKELETSMVADMAEQAYTGAAVTPGFVITFNDMRLVEGTDYTVEYADNTEIGTATATITGTGNYTGTLTKEFTIAMAKLTLDETEDNSEVLAAADGKPFDVTLKRTLQTGSWNTFAVPFDIDTPDGWTVKELKSSTLADGTLTLSFGNAQGIEAGKPYLVKVADKVETPTFKGVTVSTDFVKTETTAVDFVPTLGKTAIEGDATSILFLGAGNKLFYPTQLPSDMKGFRAYFQLKGDATSARSFRMDFGDGETTSIKTTNFTNYTNSEEWYDLQGRRVNGAAKKGVYIVNGKKTVVK